MSLFGLVDRPENVMALSELVEQPFILFVTLLFGPMEHSECVVALFGSVSKQPKSIITLFQSVQQHDPGRHRGIIWVGETAEKKVL